jgi:hypothetical protein
MSNERTRRRPRQWSNGDIIAILAAMVVVMALITFTLHRNSRWLLLVPVSARQSPAQPAKGA